MVVFSRYTGIIGFVVLLLQCITINLVQAATLTFTPTATPALPQVVWQEDFLGGTPGSQPMDWQDASDVPVFHAELSYSYENSYAVLTRTSEDIWGKSLSPTILCDTSQFNTIELHISELSPLTTWRVGIQEITGSWQYQDLCPSQDQTGVFIFNYSSVMGWNGTHAFSVQLTVEGDEGDYLVVDYIRVRMLPPTLTATPSRTVTPTMTLTPTPSGPTHTPTMTPTVAVLSSDFWFEGFRGDAGTQPTGWIDETQEYAFNAEVSHSSDGASALIVRTADDVWGKVISPAVICDVNAYPRVAIDVQAISPMTSWKLNVLEYGTTNQWNLCASQTGTGIFEFDYAHISGLNGEKKIVFQIIIEGAEGTSVTIDQIQVLGNRSQGTAFAQVHFSEPDQISIQDTVVKLKGVNYYPSTHGWQKMWLEWEPEMIHAELSRAQLLGMNMVRACIHYSEFGGPNVKPEMLARMEEFLYIAAKYNMKVQFTFFPYFRDYSPAVRQDMKDHVGAILERFKNDDRILGWGMTNELDIHVALIQGDMSAMPEALAWFEEMAAYMQWVDTNHLVIAPTSWPDTMRSLDLTNIDVYALHYYGTLAAYQGSIMRTRSMMMRNQCVKPILLEEFGIDYSTAPTAIEVENYFQHVWETVFNTDIAGGIVWILNDTEQDGTPHLWGLFTADGTMRDGVSINATAYTGSHLFQPTLISRPITPLQTTYPVCDEEAILLNSQLPLVEDKWVSHENRADHTAQDGGVLIHNIVRGSETYGYGHIEKVYAVGVNMDDENDLRINIKNVTGRWYAFLGNTPTGYLTRLQYDTPVKGTFVYNLRDYVPDALKTGEQFFTIAIGGVEAMYCLDAASVLVENVSMANGVRPSPEPTPEDTYWREAFQGTLWVQPEGWVDETDDDSFNCQIAYSATNSFAVVTRTAQDTWGKVRSPVISCDVMRYNMVEVIVAEVSPSTTWKLVIQENGGAGKSWDLCTAQAAAGHYRFSIPDHTGLVGNQVFQCQLTIQGASGRYIVVDTLKIVSIPPTPTMTATITPTMTPTPTLGDTATDTSTPTMTPTPWMAPGAVIAYPNPARNTVHFAYTVKGQTKVIVDIYKITGERVGHIVEQHSIGSEQTLVTQWNAIDIAPGIYFCRIVIRDGQGKIAFSHMKKIAIIK